MPAVFGYQSGGEVTAPISSFVLQFHDGREWREIPATNTEGNMAVQWHCRFDPVTAKRFRLLVREAKDNVSRIWEVELYEPAP